MQKKKVVVIGGGNGSAISIVALKQNLDLFDISAVVAMSDSGYSSGAFRKTFNMLPPGDILRASLALSRYDYTILKPIFNGNRFKSLTNIEEKLKAPRGPGLGNLFLAWAAEQEGDFMKAVRGLEEVIETVGHAHPNSLVQTDLYAELSNGDIIKTEHAIDEPAYDRSLKIKRVWLEPEVKANEEAIKVILEADYIIFGPGSLYTSVIATILPKGIKEAIDKNKTAKLIYVVGNAYHTNGETGPEDVAGCARALENYLPRSLDLVIYSGDKLTEEQKKKYDIRGWSLLTDNGDLLGEQLLRAPYEKDSGGVCSIKLGKILKEVCK